MDMNAYIYMNNTAPLRQGVTVLSLLVSRLAASRSTLVALPAHLPGLAAASKISLKAAAEQLSSLRGPHPETRNSQPRNQKTERFRPRLLPINWQR